MNAAISVNGEALIAAMDGALYWPARETLIVADLHLEKGSSFAMRGVMLPPYDTRATLRRLARLVERWRPARIISLGDAFHDGGAEGRMDGEDASLLAWLISGRRWTWILGNHDPAPPVRFAAAVESSLRLGPLIFEHEPHGGLKGAVCGHLHPVARVKAETRLIRRRCFASCGEQVVLPAFGAYAGGLNVLDQAFAPVFRDFTAWVIGAKGVYPFASAALLPD